jgi:8-oxo-dGTP pyrophosphatase MutT (NUDIX family)
VYREGRDGLEIVLCGRTAEGLWALPKGTPSPGERLEETAVREVEEETGLRVAIERPLGAIRYRFVRPDTGTTVRKTVCHYLMRAVGGDLSAHDHEFDRVDWFPVEEAMRLMTYPNEASMVRRAVDIIEARREARR